MIRDAIKDGPWFDKWTDYDEARILQMQEMLKKRSANSSYRPQYMYDLGREYRHLLLRRYSRGDSIRELAQYFSPMLDTWEEAERLGKEVWTEQQQYTRHAWKVNLDHYIVCFWLVGLALALDVPDSQWSRLVALIGNEGEDELLDRVIATRQPERRIGTGLCHPQPYQRLLDTINAPPEDQPAGLKAFVEHWYRELDRPPKKGLARETAMYERPYWYEYHLADGGYFGYWCIEAVAAAKAFGIDDSPCLGLLHYPGDLLRPDGPSTHRQPTPAVQRQATNAVAIKRTLADRVRKALFAPRS